MTTKSLKPGWKRAKFGEVVRLSKERSSDPLSDGYDRYLGLDHLEPGDLRIRRWGNVADGVTFTSVFKPGQVLFGKRRAYQRKVAVADFAGVCSGDIYVFESVNPKVLLPELLPFLCQTDAFFEHAVGTSAGSLSPRTNWTSLANFEFALPPLDEQVELSRLLKAFDDVIVTCNELRQNAKTASSAALLSIITSESELSKAIKGFSNTSNILLPPGWRLISAKDLCIAPITSGTTPREGICDRDTGNPFIRVQNLGFDGKLDFSNAKFLDSDAFASTKSTHVIPGDVLTNIVGPPLGKVGVIPLAFPESQINQAIVRFRPPNEIYSRYMAHYLMSDLAKSWLFSRSKKTSGQRNINSSTCAALPVPLPPEDQLNDVIQCIDGLLSVLDNVDERINKISRLKSGVMAKRMGG